MKIELDIEFFNIDIDIYISNSEICQFLNFIGSILGHAKC